MRTGVQRGVFVFGDGGVFVVVGDDGEEVGGAAGEDGLESCSSSVDGSFARSMLLPLSGCVCFSEVALPLALAPPLVKLVPLPLPPL